MQFDGLIDPYKHTLDELLQMTLFVLATPEHITRLKINEPGTPNFKWKPLPKYGMFTSINAAKHYHQVVSGFSPNIEMRPYCVMAFNREQRNLKHYKVLRLLHDDIIKLWNEEIVPSKT
jgi:hypothetical protein